MWYGSMPKDFRNRDENKTQFPAFVCDFGTRTANCRESNFTTFTQYVYYVVSETTWAQSSLDANIDLFVSLCKDFYEVGGIYECSYSNATAVSWIHEVSDRTGCQKSTGGDGSEGCRFEGPEGCVRVRNVEREKNLDYKPFVVASLAVFAGKEFAKALYVLFVWLRVSTRPLQPLEVALVGESPFVLLLLWRRPGFKHELLFAQKSWQSLLAIFFIEDVLEGVNQAALVVVFSVTISRRGVDSGIMFSLIASTLKVAGRLYALAAACEKSRRNSIVQVRDESSLVIVRETNLQDDIAGTSTGGHLVPGAEETGASSATTKVEGESTTAAAGATETIPLPAQAPKTTTTRIPTPTTTKEKGGDKNKNNDNDNEQLCEGRRNSTVKVQNESRLAIVRAKALSENNLKSLQDKPSSASAGGHSVRAVEEAGESSSTTAQ